MVLLEEQIALSDRLVRRPTRDDREEVLPVLLGDDGNILAIVEMIPVECAD